MAKDPVQQDDQLTDFTIQMRVIHCAVLSPFNGSWNYALASVSSYKTSDNFTTLASEYFFFLGLTVMTISLQYLCLERK